GPYGPICTQLYRIGSEVDIQASPAPDSVFLGWGGACSGTGPCHVTVTEAAAVTATFRGPQPLTLKLIGLDGGGGSLIAMATDGGPMFNCDNLMTPNQTCTVLYRVNTVVDIAASLSAGTHFVGWGGACSGTGACRVTLSEATEVTATFRG